MIQDSLGRISQSILVLSVWGRLCLFPGFASCQVCKKIIRSVSCPLGVWVALLCSEKICLLGREGLSKYSVVLELVTTCWGTTASRQRPRSRCVHGCCFHDVLSIVKLHTRLPTNDMFMGDTTLQPWQPWLQGHCALFASAECNPHSSHLAWVRKHARLSLKLRHRLSNYLIIHRSLNWAVSIRSNYSVACFYKGLIFVRITFWEVAVELPFLSETRESSLRHLKWDLASWWWAHLGAFKRLTPWPIGGWSSWIQRPTRVGWMNGQLGWVEWMCWMSKGDVCYFPAFPVFWHFYSAACAVL